MPSAKTFNVQVLDSDGSTFRKNLTGLVKSEITFPSRINGGLGELVLDLKLPFDDFDEGVSIADMNIVEVYAVDPDNPLGRRIYRGFISRYESYFQSGDEGVRVTCLGLGSLTTLIYYKSGSSFTVSHSGQDPIVIFKAIIDHFGTVYAGLLSYDGSSIPSSVGTSVSVDFVDQKHFEALEKVHSLAGTDWWWSIDRDGVAHFKAKPSTPTHLFTIGKNVQSLKVTKDSEGIINDVQVRGADGNIANDSDATSQTVYGKRSLIDSDTGLTDSAARTQRASKDVEDAKDAKIVAQLVISALDGNEGYDIESIQVGDTCAVQNYRLDSGLFDDNMMIAGLAYTPVAVTLDLERLDRDLGSAMQSFVERIGGGGGSSGGGGGGGSETFVDREVPSGSIDGSNVTFVLAATPDSGSEYVFLNGILQNEGSDYTIAADTITFIVAPPTGSVLLVSYRVAVSVAFTDKEVPSGTIDGSNTSFTIAGTPVTDSEYVYLNGILLNGGGNDYTLSGTTITFVTAPPSGSVLLVSYRT